MVKSIVVPTGAGPVDYVFDLYCTGSTVVPPKCWLFTLARMCWVFQKTFDEFAKR